jgi:hypothetical protein
MVYLALVQVFRKRRLRRLLTDDGKEQGAPANHSLLFAKSSGKIELYPSQSSYSKESPCSMRGSLT